MATFKEVAAAEVAKDSDEALLKMVKTMEASKASGKFKKWPKNLRTYHEAAEAEAKKRNLVI